MTHKDALKIYSDIFQLLQLPELDGDTNFCGFIVLDDNIVVSLNALVAHGLCGTSVDIYQNEELKASPGVDTLNNKHFPYRCKITLSSNWERGGYYIGANWDLLLKSATRISNPVKQAFFTDTCELTKNDNINYSNYLKLSKVCEFIDEVALPTSDNNERTIIYGRDINIYYTLKESDLQHDLCIEAIEKLLDKDLHHEVKVALVREALVKFLKDIGSKLRFSHLICHFSSFTSDLLLSYHTYAERYTFDKVRKEYQEKQTEYIRKVNEAYSDVGAKVLAIPAGLWLAVFKLEEAKVGSFEFIKNIIILMLCILCMCYAIFNFTAQFSILDSIKTEYQSLFERLAADNGEESKSINVAKNLIDKSARMTWWKLALSNFGTAVVFIMVITLSGYSL
jgi:hypothetical protein